MQDLIYILDLDEALSGLIARTLRGQQVYCEPVPFGITAAQACSNPVKGLIIAARPDQEVSLEGFDLSLLSCGVPVLALGGAVPALCEHFGGSVLQRESENENVTLSFSDQPLFSGLNRGERVLHNLRDLALPESLACLATATERCIGFSREAANLYAVQYPIERNDPDAIQLLSNFACLVCGAQACWTEETIAQSAVDALRAAAGEGRVMCAVSGGTGSAVCAQLARQAVGDRLECVFVDTGLYRNGEPEEIVEEYEDEFTLPITRVDAKETFLKALSGLRSEGEKDRVAAGLLRQVFYKLLTQNPDVSVLALGTNYNDVLYGCICPEPAPTSVQGRALTVMEPLNRLFREEIRRLGKALGLSAPVCQRQPFPVSGLAQRILGPVTPGRLEILRQADAIFTEEIIAAGQDRRLWQYYASLCENPDERHGYAVILRACQPCGGDACASRLPYDLLERATQRILSELSEVRRVTYDLTPSQHYALME